MVLDFKDYPFVSDSTRLGGSYNDADGEVTVSISVFGGKVPKAIDVIDHTGREVEYKFYAVAVDGNDQLIGWSYFEDAVDVPAVNLVLAPIGF